MSTEGLSNLINNLSFPFLDVTSTIPLIKELFINVKVSTASIYLQLYNNAICTTTASKIKRAKPETNSGSQVK